MKVTLFLDKSEGDTITIKNKILSVLNPSHIIFDHWDGGEPETQYCVKSVDGTEYTTSARDKDIAIVDYVDYCNGSDDATIFSHYAEVLTWDKILATFNNKYATCDGDKILSIKEI